MRRAFWLLAGFTACSVRGATVPPEQGLSYACEADDDCTTGRCLGDFGICSQNATQLTSFLFEVTPQASDPVYGGASFLIRKDLRLVDLLGSESRGIPPGWLELNVRPRVPVRGRVLAPQQQQACSASAGSTLPVTLTFTPRERLFGLSVPSYELDTELDRSLDPPEYTFEGALPPGRYDVYMRPDSSALDPSCIVIPQLFRNLSIGDPAGASGAPEMAAIDLTPPPANSLRITMPWRDTLNGWWLDMVHPVSGELISNRVLLRAADVEPDASELVATLYYSPIDPPETDEGEPSEPGDLPTRGASELVRFTPPQDANAATVLLERQGIEALIQGEGTISDISTFGAPVEYQAWAWSPNGTRYVPVPGVARFAAIELDEVEVGVTTEFVREAEVDERGYVQLSLLPGKYRVRFTPPSTPVPGVGHAAGYEVTHTVWPSINDATSRQEGHLIDVPAAVSIGGQVVSENNDEPVFGSEIRASPSSPERDPCLQPGEDQPAGGCSIPLNPVLRKAKARDPFQPRTRTGVSGVDGTFTVLGLDCGQCTPGLGASFDVSVRPPPESGLAWHVLPSLNIYAARSLGTLRLPVPVAQPTRLTYADPTEAGEARGLPGALVRVFAMIDDRLEVVTQLEGIQACKATINPDGRRCIQSLLQVAELRSGEDGELLLLLPPNIE